MNDKSLLFSRIHDLNMIPTICSTNYYIVEYLYPNFLDLIIELERINRQQCKNMLILYQLSIYNI